MKSNDRVSVHFFDTSALKYRYVEGKPSRGVRRLISNGSVRCVMADVSFLEIASAFGAICRDRSWGVGRFDALTRGFHDDLAKGRIEIRLTSNRDVVRARHLIRFAGVVLGRGLKSADALIATACLELALAEKTRVVFLTGDQKLFNALTAVDAFRTALRLRYVEA